MPALTSAPAIGYVNRASGKSISATTAAAGYPATNLSNARMSSAWRSTAVTAQDLIADLTTAQDIDVMALIGHNGEDDGQARWRTSENSNLSTPEHDSGTISAFDVTHGIKLSDTPVWGRNAVYFLQNTVNSRYAGITVTDAANPDTYLQGRVFWAGPIWQPPMSMMAEDFNPAYPLIGVPGVQRQLRGWRMRFANLSDAQSRELMSVLTNILNTKRLLFVPRPTETATFLQDAIYCTREGEITRNPLPTFYKQWSIEFSLREVED